MKRSLTPTSKTPPVLKTYSQIQSYLQLPIELLQKVGDDEQASVLIGIQKTYSSKVFDYLRENNLKQIQIDVSSSRQMTYTLPTK